MSKISSIPQAARLARAMASDIAIYNQEKIQRGLEQDRLFEELEDDLREGLAMWNSKVSDEIVASTNLLQKAFVDIVFGGSAHIKSPIC
ncbi:MAG: hypothetical protein H6697_08235 [Myxococcales bacterium]|nr:hypothetical protein [Myxococcales bacterium]MCB9521097.1 hypothetical protein [Myxococcales bacterium]